MINKAVIPAAGLGTRLLTTTKEMPKEMLPIFARSVNRRISVKPLLQVIFEQIRSFGILEFCFVVGREKRAIVDHFTQDAAFVEKLRASGKTQQVEDLQSFYRAVSTSAITWTNQPEPRGFGHSLLMASAFIGGEHFVVHAGDTHIISPRASFLKRLVKAHESGGAQATLLLLRVPPTKGYGFAIVKGHGPSYEVTRVVEKPEKPPSRLAIMPVYVLGPEIMRELKSVKPGVGGELQLTDGIEQMIERGYKVQAIELTRNEVRLDIGTPELYWEALRLSHKLFSRIR